MTPDEFEAAVKDAEVQLSRLKHLYDQWFQGFERLEPHIPRKNFERTLGLLRKAKMRRAALRFRFQMLVQRYTTLQTYWRRVARQIEEGTYRRDLMKVRRKREAQRAQLTGKTAKDPDTLQDLELDLDAQAGPYQELDHSAKSKPPKRSRPRPAPRQVYDDPLPEVTAQRTELDDLFPGAAAKRPAARDVASEGQQRSTRKRRDSKAPPEAPTRSSGPGEARLRQLYDAHVREKKKNKESVDNVNYEKVAKRIKQMVPKIEREHKGKQVDFEVVVKNGKVGLKPIVKK